MRCPLPAPWRRLGAGWWMLDDDGVAYEIQPDGDVWRRHAYSGEDDYTRPTSTVVAATRDELAFFTRLSAGLLTHA